MARNRIEARVRAYFHERGFLFVDPPALQRSPGNETHLHAFRTEMIGNDGTSEPMYLATSPEFSMKKLLAAGEERIVSLGHVWRNRERGPLHHPEFTMLEWYRVDEPYDAVIEDCIQIARIAAEEARRSVWTWRGGDCDVTAEPERIGVVDAFRTHAGIDLFATMNAAGRTDADALAIEMQRAGITVPDERDWSYFFSRILTEKVEPNLGNGRITVLDAYPAAEAALARRKPDDQRLSERFELYIAGVELANGFGELTDAEEQRRRFEAEMEAKHRIYGETYPIDEDLLSALPAMRRTSGVALGFDRLVMLALGAPRIDDVIWVPVAGDDR
jgi:lysyl-tRNA synthetase class 2